jgi:hypothetical protein
MNGFANEQPLPKISLFNFPDAIVVELFALTVQFLKERSPEPFWNSNLLPELKVQLPPPPQKTIVEPEGLLVIETLNTRNTSTLQLATFTNNRIRRFAPTEIDEILSGFKQLKGEKIKSALKSFQVSI